MPKIKLSDDKVRKAYYELSDKISQAKEELVKLDNPAIKTKLKQMEELRDELYQELENNYLWD